MTQKPARRLIVAAGIVGVASTVLTALVCCVLVLPPLIVTWGLNDSAAAPLSAVDRLRTENDVRSVLLQALAGLVALAGVAAGAAVTVHQIRVNREGHTIGLFTTAVEQLSSPQVSVRHGGVYTLAFLAGLDSRYAGKIHALLTAFIRQQAPWPPTRPPAEVDHDRSRFHGGLADDVGGAISALADGTMITEGAVSELENVDLRDAQLNEFAIGRVCLIGSNLSKASLVNADLSGASMTNTILRGTNLTGATLSGADLSAADLHGAVLAAVVYDADTQWPPGFHPPR
ncbi:pentapeptide repeat-containing protein [Virgisporangium ochraceum]|uniref:Pentapeptide repeat protein n=1 Tax=Virgisporangium ochraceum TaxID=65505 RepID=A0A8J3ZZ94_9ACTN|nr:pentapeptide repeat-containing protein [Virgisporangium ochraceum]GIJ72782.1 hypothetical protein Voc01_076990 [Virgisporangium ochraceum]